MKEVKFEIEIVATKEKVWSVLWQDNTFRQWADIIDPGTYLVGELIEGNEVQFISGNGYGVTSLVERLTPGVNLTLRHRADTQEAGAREREKEWTGGTESYHLSESNGVTTLSVSFDVPLELEEYFQTAYPTALTKVKAMAEQQSR